MARSRRAGRPDLRRALGGPPPGRDHDRGRPDRDPPLRRWRGRQRRLRRSPRSPGATRRTRWRAMRSSRGSTAPSCGRRRRRTSGTSTPSASRPTRASERRRARGRARDTLLADFRHRKLDVEDEATGARRSAVLRGQRLDGGPPRGDAPRGSRRVAHADVEEVPLAATRALDIEWVTAYDENIESVAGASRRSARPLLGAARDARVRDPRPTCLGFTPARGGRRRGRDRRAVRDAVGARAGRRRAAAWRRRWPPAGVTWPGSSPTTRAAHGRSTSGSALRPCGARTASCGARPDEEDPMADVQADARAAGAGGEHRDPAGGRAAGLGAVAVSVRPAGSCSTRA